MGDMEESVKVNGDNVGIAVTDWRRLLQSWNEMDQSVSDVDKEKGQIIQIL